MRTDGVSNDGAAAKVTNFDGSGKKVRPVGQREYQKVSLPKNMKIAVTPLVLTPFAPFRIAPDCTKALESQETYYFKLTLYHGPFVSCRIAPDCTKTRAVPESSSLAEPRSSCVRMLCVFIHIYIYIYREREILYKQ